MILRALFAVLVLANVGYFLWSRADESARQAAEREPQRLTQQIQPQWLKVEPAAAPAR
ncbi:sporulation protein [Xenophilus sp. Marseille-Q4582]|uniref:sporulation protein n=1 Tax=Xenophilus sp. Marseille-Q4582 TaxID=2866600 RepID=UPI001CE41E65|nr:sporulation protein [Xenophilus sp. Marseille-Q4582]